MAGRALSARERFHKGGFANVANVEGGTLAWDAAGLPVVVRGCKAISLERQVRIAAGSPVCIAAILGWPGASCLPWLWAAFVGAGPAFAGVTDTCGMGPPLARMPWNRGEASTCCETNEKYDLDFLQDTCVVDQHRPKDKIEREAVVHDGEEGKTAHDQGVGAAWLDSFPSIVGM